MLEEELILKIKENAHELSAARRKVSKLKSELIDAETDVVTFKLNDDRLKEELRILQSKKVNKELSDQDKDIQRFKKILPEIMDKISKEKDSIK